MRLLKYHTLDEKIIFRRDLFENLPKYRVVLFMKSRIDFSKSHLNMDDKFVLLFEREIEPEKLT